MTAPVLLTIPETATELRCGRDHVYDLIARGQLQPVNIGIGRSKTRIRRDDLEAFIDRQTRRVS